MGMSRVRSRQGVRLGRLHALIAGDEHVYVRWAGNALPDAGSGVDLAKVATVACVDWAVRLTLTGHAWTRRQVSGHLERACRTPSASDYAERAGTRGVVQEAPPAGTPGLPVHVDVSLQAVPGPLQRLALTWSASASSCSVADSERLMAGLWLVAEEGERGDTLHHALRALRGGFEGSGGFAPAVAAGLAASLVEFGEERAAGEREAAERRARMRLV